VRNRISFSPLLSPPSIGRRWRFGLAAFFLASLALVADALFRTIHRIRIGESSYPLLLLYLFLASYLLYLLIKVLLLPPVEK